VRSLKWIPQKEILIVGDLEGHVHILTSSFVIFHYSLFLEKINHKKKKKGNRNKMEN